MLNIVDTIYADSLLALNLAADYILLLAAGRLAGARLARGRIFTAAVVGAAYALACVLPKWGFFTHPAAKIAVGVGMCLIAFGGERRFWRCCGMFFAVSALFGGAVWGAGLLAGYDASAGLYVPVSFRTLALSFAVCYAAVTLFLRRSGVKLPRRTAQLAVSLGGRAVSLRALVDTGNVLADPVTGRAAAVCDPAALAALLGGKVSARDAVGAAQELSARPELAGRITLLPCSTVSGRALLCALRPDRAELDGREVRLLLALSAGGLDGYDAIVPGNLVQGGSYEI